MATTIVLVRHGETDWNREQRYQGHTNTPLNEAGREQARELAGLLRDEPLSAIYTSPLLRASQTAEILADRLGLESQWLEALREIDVGTWEGRTFDEVKSRYPERADMDWRSGWKEGETYEELSARVIPALLELGIEHPDESVLAVTHAGPIRAALTFAMGLPGDGALPLIGLLGNCSIYRVAIEDGRLER
ncbi:MAG: histidine phosphatase family protein [Gaiellaceae bacterium]